MKCDEKKPACSRCADGDFSCVYPNASSSPNHSTAESLDRASSSESSVGPYPTMTSDTFTLLDLRFFHHFLIKSASRPHVPVGNAAVWARDVPQLAHQNPFLMYALLALGSSHLGRLVDDKAFQVQSLTYRIKGLDGLRRAMGHMSWTDGCPDSMMASGYALMIQSAHMEDGIYDWMTLLRMVASITKRITDDNMAATAFDLRPIHHYEFIAPYLHLIPPIDPDLLLTGLESLGKLRPNLRSCSSISLYESLQRTFKSHQESPQQGYLAFGENFKFWLDLNEVDFRACIDPTNGEMQLLLAYFISALLMLLAQGVVENHDGLESSSSRHVVGMLGWVRNCLQNIPPSLEKHSQFPENLLSSATAEINGVPFPGPRVLKLDVAYDLFLKINAMQLKDRQYSSRGLGGSLGQLPDCADGSKGA